MFTTTKTAAFVVAAIAVTHFAVLGAAATALQSAADHAMIPVVKAEPIIVRANTLQIVKADRIEIRASHAV